MTEHKRIEAQVTGLDMDDDHEQNQFERELEMRIRQLADEYPTLSGSDVSVTITEDTE